MAVPGGHADSTPSEPSAFKGPTSGAAGGQASVPQSSNPAPPAQRGPAKRDSGRFLGAAVIVLVIALVAAVIWGAVGGTSKKASPAPAKTPPANSVANTAAGCPNPIPADASSTATAYLQALALGNPGWARVSTSLVAQKGEVTRQDVTLQVNADGVFLTALDKIEFPSVAALTGKELISAVTDYRNLLLIDTKSFETYKTQAAERQTDLDLRTAAEIRLLDQLGLPAATCGYLRP